MTKLAITLEGETIAEYILKTDKEYLLGRASQCDILLIHPKISRQHARLYFDGTKWNCEVISKFGLIKINGRSSNSLELQDEMHFELPPYEVHFIDQKETMEPLQKSEEVLPDEKTVDLSDKTFIGETPLKTVLIRLAPDGSPLGEVVLNREPLTAGRGSQCDLQLNDTLASRKHFSINFDGKDYILKDLDSANKTHVNNEEITERKLQSGDEIKVGQDHFRFEIINSEFEDLPPQIEESNTTPEPLASEAIGSQPAVIKYLPQTSAQTSTQISFQAAAQRFGQSSGGQIPRFLIGTVKRFNRSSNARLKILVIVFIFGFIIYSALTGNNKSPDLRNIASQPPPNGQGPSAFDRLPQDQKKYVEDTYSLALNLVTTGKYDLAAIEIAKVLQIVSNYKDARNILALCQQATEIKKQQDETERQNQDQQALRQKVSDILDGCDVLFKSKNYTKIDECTSQISELDPENERASNLRIAAKQALNHIENSKELRAENIRKKQQALKNYEQAKRDVTEKRLPAALVNLQKVEKSNFPDAEGLKDKAKQDIAVVKTRMLKESQALVIEGKTALESKEFSDALSKFNQALVMAPFNEEAKTLKTTATKQLHSEMKNVYSESVIEENLGNIESAKRKWSTILKQDDKEDPYYQKAQIKLRKYEK